MYNDISVSILKKYGWSAGEGLGKNNQGNPNPIKANYKFDSYGISYKPINSEDSTKWSNIYSNTASQIHIKNDNEISIIKSNETDDKLKSTGINVLYQNFVKSSVVWKNGLEIDENNEKKKEKKSIKRKLDNDSLEINFEHVKKTKKASKKSMEKTEIEEKKEKKSKKRKLDEDQTEIKREKKNKSKESIEKIEIDEKKEKNSENVSPAMNLENLQKTKKKSKESIEETEIEEKKEKKSKKRKLNEDETEIKREKKNKSKKSIEETKTEEHSKMIHEIEEPAKEKRKKKKEKTKINEMEIEPVVIKDKKKKKKAKKESSDVDRSDNLAVVNSLSLACYPSARCGLTVSGKLARIQKLQEQEEQRRIAQSTEL